MARLTATGKTRIGLVQFPGSNCDQDCVFALKTLFDIDVDLIWHTAKALPPLDGLIIPGGFSYGDYLRCGGLAAHSPVMFAIKDFANRGGAVIGICNGFQILTEAGLLPGVLLRNLNCRFICKFVDLKVNRDGASAFQKELAGRALRIPIAHGEGRYYGSADDLKKLWDNGQVVVQYADAHGDTSSAANPNGSLDNIAGITDASGRIFGLMPHPERAIKEELGGSTDGVDMWRVFVESL